MFNVDNHGDTGTKGKKRYKELHVRESAVGTCMPCDTFDSTGLVIYEKRNKVWVCMWQVIQTESSWNHEYS